MHPVKINKYLCCVYKCVLKRNENHHGDDDNLETCYYLTLVSLLSHLRCGALVMQAKIEINKNFRRQTNKLVTKYLLNCHICIYVYVCMRRHSRNSRKSQE